MQGVPSGRRRGARSLCRVAACAAAIALAGGACSSRDRPPPLSSSLVSTSGGGGNGGDAFDAGLPDGPVPCPDATGVCACKMVEAVADAPNLYFVLDASGSMAESVGLSENRYDAVRAAAIDLVRKLGPLIRVGAAIFPGAGGECTAGQEVFPVTAGDPVTGEDGPTTSGFAVATLRDPHGGTPTSATLAALTPGLRLLAGHTVVILATDGGPGCNPQATCDADGCMANIEQADGCDPSINCCAPCDGAGCYGPSFCVDRDASVAAIADLASSSIPVYVIGIPGSETYGSVLDAMAEAGGAEPPAGGSTAYYRVDDVGALGAVLGQIASIAVSCEIDLGGEPPDQSLTNVYLDGELLPHDPVDGWEWLSDTALELTGDACARLKAGQVKEVQVVAGCPTEGPQ